MSKRALTLARLGTKRRAAQDAGMSLHQLRQAVRVANVPADEYERLVESDDPPTIEQLANLGRQRAARARQGGTSRPPFSQLCPHCGGTGKIRT